MSQQPSTNNYQLKVCGLTKINQIQELISLNVDFLGFIFYEKSPRYVLHHLSLKEIAEIPHFGKVGVFVNGSIKAIVEITTESQLDIIQLHGNEAVSECEFLKENNIKIIKAFSIDETFNFDILNAYEIVCDYFLFDTKTPDFGGSGKIFNWQLLENYKLEKPFFLSGGLNLESIEKIRKLNYPQLIGLDFNSQLENEDLKKNKEKVTEVIRETRTI